MPTVHGYQMCDSRSSLRHRAGFIQHNGIELMGCLERFRAPVLVHSIDDDTYAPIRAVDWLARRQLGTTGV